MAYRHNKTLAVVGPDGLFKGVDGDGAALLHQPLLQASCPQPTHHSSIVWDDIH